MQHTCKILASATAKFSHSRLLLRCTKSLDLHHARYWAGEALSSRTARNHLGRAGNLAQLARHLQGQFRALSDSSYQQVSSKQRLLRLVGTRTSASALLRAAPTGCTCWVSQLTLTCSGSRSKLDALRLERIISLGLHHPRTAQTKL